VDAGILRPKGMWSFLNPQSSSILSDVTFYIFALFTTSILFGKALPTPKLEVRYAVQASKFVDRRAVARLDLVMDKVLCLLEVV
jgi:hypothetical protein